MASLRQVPSDRIVLGGIRYDGKRCKLEKAGIRKISTLSGPNVENYLAIQRTLRDQAREHGLPAIVYDFRRSEGRQ